MHMFDRITIKWRWKKIIQRYVHNESQRSGRFHCYSSLSPKIVTTAIILSKCLIIGLRNNWDTPIIILGGNNVIHTVHFDYNKRNSAKSIRQQTLIKNRFSRNRKNVHMTQWGRAYSSREMKSIPTLGVLALGRLQSGLYCERPFIHLEIRYGSMYWIRKYVCVFVCVSMCTSVCARACVRDGRY